MSSSAYKCAFYRLEQNIMQWKSPMELNLNQRCIPMDKTQKRRWEKWAHLSSYHNYTQSYGYENVISGSFVVFSADGSKNQVTVWAKYLSASGRSHLALLANARNCWVRSYHLQDAIPWKYRILVFFADSAVFLLFLSLISHKR